MRFLTFFGHQVLLVCPLLCFLLLLLSVSLLAPEEDICCPKRLLFPCFSSHWWVHCYSNIEPNRIHRVRALPVDVQQYWIWTQRGMRFLKLYFRSFLSVLFFASFFFWTKQNPLRLNGLTVPNSPYGLCGRTATLNQTEPTEQSDTHAKFLPGPVCCLSAVCVKAMARRLSYYVPLKGSSLWLFGRWADLFRCFPSGLRLLRVIT